MSQVTRISRRDFLGAVSSAGALVLAAQVPPLKTRHTLAATESPSIAWSPVPFDIPNIHAENGPAQNHVRIGGFHSVANIYHGFAIQSFIDELVAAAGRDRIEFFLEVLGRPRTIDFKAEGTTNPNNGKSLDQYPVDTGRLRRVVEVVAGRCRLGAQEPGERSGARLCGAPQFPELCGHDRRGLCARHRQGRTARKGRARTHG
jgi:hypothetical protein